jgi:phosphoketolase
MLGEVIDRPNPQPVRSNMPEYVDQLLVKLDKLDKPTLPEKTNQVLTKYRQAANYIAAAMIFLQDNVKLNAARVYLPPDANTFLSTIAHCFKSKNYVNLMVGSNDPLPSFSRPTKLRTTAALAAQSGSSPPQITASALTS